MMLKPIRSCRLLMIYQLFILTVLVSSAQAADGPRVAIAASLRAVWPELMTNYLGPEPRVSFGSSGNLMRQIRQGAPFELFLSADEAFVEQLVEFGLTQDNGAIYAVGRLALVTADSIKTKSHGHLTANDIATRLGSISKKNNYRWAIANPRFAPYGKAARDVLEKANIWTDVEKNLLLGENASQALQFALSGAAAGGIVPMSLVSENSSHKNIHVEAIDPQLHRVLVHRMVRIKRASPSTDNLYAYLLSQEARAVLQNYGFNVPR